jgi:propanediol dehydratase small subunit
MSPNRIAVGVLVGAFFLAFEFAAFWYLDLRWEWIPLGLVAFAVGGGLLVEIQTRKALRRYWERACMGIRWRRRFPDAPKAEIREFLDLFVEAFGFRRKRRCCFSPDDRVMEVYRTLYPPGSEFDSMELETFCTTLRKRYGVNFAASWRDDITLGELYARTRQQTAS